ncbi:MAG: hypothetical protein IPH82_02430 [Chloroflexi bacterium]|nr:hypothetical protein [Chloroflexota bacterium]
MTWPRFTKSRAAIPGRETGGGVNGRLPLPRLLTDLKEAKTREIEQLYRRIYWQVWRSLSPPGQTLLEMMPITAGMGATPEQLQAMSGLDESAYGSPSANWSTAPCWKCAAQPGNAVTPSTA